MQSSHVVPVHPEVEGVELLVSVEGASKAKVGSITGGSELPPPPPQEMIIIEENMIVVNLINLCLNIVILPIILKFHQ